MLDRFKFHIYGVRCCKEDIQLIVKLIESRALDQIRQLEKIIKEIYKSE